MGRWFVALPDFMSNESFTALYYVVYYDIDYEPPANHRLQSPSCAPFAPSQYSASNSHFPEGMGCSGRTVMVY